MKLFAFLFFLLIPQFASACYYINPKGSDSNSGTATSPFRTATPARIMMESTAKGVKCVYFQAGVYPLVAPITLTSADNGETWGPDPTAPSLTAILDGQRYANEIFMIYGGSNITITGLRMRNTLYSGIRVHGGVAVSPTTDNVTTGAAANNVFSNNEISDIMGSTYIENDNGAGVSIEGNVPNNSILNNYVHDTSFMGIEVRTQHNPGQGDTISGTLIQGNVVLNTNRIQGDTGGIYIHDWTAASTNIVINNNYIKDWQGPFTYRSNCIYLDSATSNATVTGNVCGPPGPGAPQQAAVFYICGNNITIVGNIFDLGAGAQVATLKIATCGPPPPVTSMTGVTFNSNIIVSSFTTTQNTVFTAGNDGYSYVNSALPAGPTITNNLYYNYGGGSVVTTGRQYSDANPTTGDPLCSGWNYVLSSTSPAYSTPVFFPGIVGPVGPPGFSLPQTGTPPSCPH